MKRIIAIAVIIALAIGGAEAKKKKDSAKFTPELSLEVDGLLFFQNDEFESPLAKGYTLPGYNLTPKLIYKPTQNIKIDLGVYSMHYWGAHSYPNLSYDIIPSYDEEKYSKAVHVLPYFSVEMSTANGWKFILGNLHGGMRHGLIMPLYSREREYMSDPEAGAQILYSNDWIDLDVWSDWRRFIYYNSPYQENFFVGATSRFKLNKEASATHIYAPVQVLAEHRGGEIDTILFNSVQTLMNASVGLGTKFNLDKSSLRSITVEANAIASYQQAGHVWPYRKGWGAWVLATAEIGKTREKLGFLHAHKFITLQGLPLMSVASISHPDDVINRNNTIYASFEYTHEFAPGYELGVSADLYYLLPCKKYSAAEQAWENCDGGASFLIGAYMRICPSFLLKKFKKK